MKSNQDANEFQQKANLIEKKLEKMKKRLGSPTKPRNSNHDHNLSREMNNKLIYNHSKLW